MYTGLGLPGAQKGAGPSATQTSGSFVLHKMVLYKFPEGGRIKLHFMNCTLARAQLACVQNRWHCRATNSDLQMGLGVPVLSTLLLARKRSYSNSTTTSRRAIRTAMAGCAATIAGKSYVGFSGSVLASWMSSSFCRESP